MTWSLPKEKINRNCEFYAMLRNQTNSTEIYDIFSPFCKSVVYGKYLVAIVGIISNILIPLTVMKSEKLRCKSAGILMIALACTDSLYLGSKIALLLDRTEVNIFSPECIVHLYILFVTRSTSNILVVMTAVNRYALMCHPHSHHRVTSKKGATIQIIISAVLAISGNSIYVVLKFLKKKSTCKPHQHNQDMYSLNLGFLIFHLLIFDILPYLVTSVLSVLVFMSTKKRQHKLCPRSNRRTRKIEIQLTRAMISVVVAFVILSVPLLLCKSILIFFEFKHPFRFELHNVYCFLDLFRDINHGINLYLYLIFCKMFAHLFVQELLHLPCRKKRINASTLHPEHEMVEL